ncbi:DUF6328 family protein [Microbacterium sp.]|uniref:DUF6328 family protein n=1 Tax=Microbacterium sp. TaxID=51671 RepID=UPI0025EB5456|nr:DUF6328 family protein [Microbacterium sp.]
MSTPFTISDVRMILARDWLEKGEAMPGDGRNETENQRADRNWEDILQELRVTQTGTQILTGFLLAVAFQPTFHDLEAYERGLYLCLVVLAGTATIVGITPVIMHRRQFQHRQKGRLVRRADRVLIILLVLVTLLACGVTSLIFDVALDRTAGLVALGVALAVSLGAWIAVPQMSPRGRRSRGADEVGS